MRFLRRVLIYTLVVSILFSTSLQSVFAAGSLWTQTDWSGGSGQTAWNSASKYFSSSNVVSSTANQLTIVSQSNWYDISWGYRQSVSVTNTSGAELTDYQIPIFLDTSALISASKMKNDCSDLRVTDANNTVLSYWIATSPTVNTCKQTTTKIWVKAPSIPTAGLTLYMYYGNNSASSLSNGSNVFSVFADFTSGSTLPTNWVKTDVGTSGTASVDGGKLSIMNDKGEDVWENAYGATHVYNNTKVSGSFIAESYVTSQTNSDVWAKSGIMAINTVASGTSNGQSFVIVTPGNGVRFQYQDSAIYPAANNNSLTGASYTLPVFLKLTKDAGRNVAGYFSTSGSSWTKEGNTVKPENIAESQYVALFATPHSLVNSGTATYTFFYVRKYSAAEPSVGSPGSEETPYTSSGNLVSSIFDTNQSSAFGTLTYTASSSANTSVGVKIRTANNSDMTGAADFSSCTAIPSGTTISSNTCAPNGNRYVQYQVVLTSSNKTTTPMFQSISIEYMKDAPHLPPVTSSSCSGDKPSSIPDLFQIDTTEEAATLYFTPISNTSTYYISFSTHDSAEEHGAEVRLGKEGVQSYTIHSLSPNTTYYMKVRGQNGCTPGEWSGIRKGMTKGEGTIMPTDAITEEIPEENIAEEKPVVEKTIEEPPVVLASAEEKEIPAVRGEEKFSEIKKPDMYAYVEKTKAFSQALTATISNNLFFLGEKIQNISEGFGYMLVDAGYAFISEPTKIFDIQTTVLSPTSVKISWKTNHPANGKVNYGLDRTYGADIQSEKRVTDHEFTLTNLLPDTAYSFEVMSHAKTYVYDANREFRTLKE